MASYVHTHITKDRENSRKGREKEGQRPINVRAATQVRTDQAQRKGNKACQQAETQKAAALE